MKAILLIIVVAFVSCSTTKNIDIKFKAENVNTLISYLDAKNITYTKSDLATLNGINTFTEYNNTEKLTIPEAYFFNKDGNRVKDNFKGTNCSQVINNINQINKASSESKENIKDWIGSFKFISTTDSQLNVDSNYYDAYIIIPWAIFADRFNETSFNWYNDIKTNSNLKIKTILINLDVQDNWNMNHKQRAALGLVK